MKRFSLQLLSKNTNKLQIQHLDSLCSIGFVLFNFEVKLTSNSISFLQNRTSILIFRSIWIIVTRDEITKQYTRSFIFRKIATKHFSKISFSRAFESPIFYYTKEHTFSFLHLVISYVLTTCIRLLIVNFKISNQTRKFNQHTWTVDTSYPNSVSECKISLRTQCLHSWIDTYVSINIC